VEYVATSEKIVVAGPPKRSPRGTRKVVTHFVGRPAQSNRAGREWGNPAPSARRECFPARVSAIPSGSHQFWTVMAGREGNGVSGRIRHRTSFGV